MLQKETDLSMVQPPTRKMQANDKCDNIKTPDRWHGKLALQPILTAEEPEIIIVY